MKKGSKKLKSPNSKYNVQDSHNLSLTQVEANQNVATTAEDFQFDTTWIKKSCKDIARKTLDPNSAKFEKVTENIKSKLTILVKKSLSNSIIYSAELWESLKQLWTSIEVLLKNTETTNNEVSQFISSVLASVIDFVIANRNQYQHNVYLTLEKWLSVANDYQEELSMDIILRCRTFFSPRYRKAQHIFPLLRKVLFDQSKRLRNINSFLKFCLLVKGVVVMSKKDCSLEQKLLLLDIRKRVSIPKDLGIWATQNDIDWYPYENPSFKMIVQRIDVSSTYQMLYPFQFTSVGKVNTPMQKHKVGELSKKYLFKVNKMNLSEAVFPGETISKIKSKDTRFLFNEVVLQSQNADKVLKARKQSKENKLEERMQSTSFTEPKDLFNRVKVVKSPRSGSHCSTSDGNAWVVSPKPLKKIVNGWEISPLQPTKRVAVSFPRNDTLNLKETNANYNLENKVNIGKRKKRNNSATVENKFQNKIKAKKMKLVESSFTETNSSSTNTSENANQSENVIKASKTSINSCDAEKQIVVNDDINKALGKNKQTVQGLTSTVRLSKKKMRKNARILKNAGILNSHERCSKIPFSNKRCASESTDDEENSLPAVRSKPKIRRAKRKGATSEEKQILKTDIKNVCEPEIHSANGSDSDLQFISVVEVEKETLSVKAASKEESEIDEASGSDGDLVPCDEANKMFTKEETLVYNKKILVEHNKEAGRDLQRKVKEIIEKEEKMEKLEKNEKLENEIKEPVETEENIPMNGQCEKKERLANIESPKHLPKSKSKIENSDVMMLLYKRNDEKLETELDVEGEALIEAVEEETKTNDINLIVDEDDDLEIIFDTIRKDTRKKGNVVKEECASEDEVITTTDCATNVPSINTSRNVSSVSDQSVDYVSQIFDSLYRSPLPQEDSDCEVLTKFSKYKKRKSGEIIENNSMSYLRRRPLSQLESRKSFHFSNNKGLSNYVTHNDEHEEVFKKAKADKSVCTVIEDNKKNENHHIKESQKLEAFSNGVEDSHSSASEVADEAYEASSDASDEPPIRSQKQIRHNDQKSNPVQCANSPLSSQHLGITNLCTENQKTLKENSSEVSSLNLLSVQSPKTRSGTKRSRTIDSLSSIRDSDCNEVQAVELDFPDHNSFSSITPKPSKSHLNNSKNSLLNSPDFCDIQLKIDELSDNPSEEYFESSNRAQEPLEESSKEYHTALCNHITKSISNIHPQTTYLVNSETENSEINVNIVLTKNCEDEKSKRNSDSVVTNNNSEVEDSEETVDRSLTIDAEIEDSEKTGNRGLTDAEIEDSEKRSEIENSEISSDKVLTADSEVKIFENNAKKGILNNEDTKNTSTLGNLDSTEIIVLEMTIPTNNIEKERYSKAVCDSEKRFNSADLNEIINDPENIESGNEIIGNESSSSKSKTSSLDIVQSVISSDFEVVHIEIPQEETLSSETNEKVELSFIKTEENKENIVNNEQEGEEVEVLSTPTAEAEQSEYVYPVDIPLDTSNDKIQKKTGSPLKSLSTVASPRKDLLALKRKRGSPQEGRSPGKRDLISQFLTPQKVSTAALSSEVIISPEVSDEENEVIRKTGLQVIMETEEFQELQPEPWIRSKSPHKIIQEEQDDDCVAILEIESTRTSMSKFSPSKLLSKSSKKTPQKTPYSTLPLRKSPKSPMPVDQKDSSVDSKISISNTESSKSPSSDSSINQVEDQIENELNSTSSNILDSKPKTRSVLRKSSRFIEKLDREAEISNSSSSTVVESDSNITENEGSICKGTSEVDESESRDKVISPVKRVTRAYLLRKTTKPELSEIIPEILNSPRRRRTSISSLKEDEATMPKGLESPARPRSRRNSGTPLTPIRRSRRISGIKEEDIINL